MLRIRIQAETTWIQNRIQANKYSVPEKSWKFDLINNRIPSFECVPVRYISSLSLF